MEVILGGQEIQKGRRKESGKEIMESEAKKIAKEKWTSKGGSKLAHSGSHSIASLKKKIQLQIFEKFLKD